MSEMLRELKYVGWCHPANSVRFKCRCGRVHHWPYGSRGKYITCICGRVHGREYASWRESSHRSRNAYGREGCNGHLIFENALKHIKKFLVNGA